VYPELQSVVKNAQLQKPSTKEPRAFWRAKTDEALWNDVARGGIAIVGLRAPGKERGVEQGQVVISESEQLRAVALIDNLPGLAVLERDRRLPIVRVRVSELSALKSLRRLPHIDYIEPEIDFSVPPSRFFQSGCSNSGYGGETRYVSTGDIYGPNISYFMGIERAWDVSSGSGVTIGLVDTGVDPDHPQLNGAFAAGLSGGRTITKTYRTGSDPNDYCGHGTHMAGVLAAPRDGSNVLGVAWRANLFSVKVNGDVWLDGTNVTATRLGIGDAADVSKVVVMGFGSTNGWSSIQDELAYWYHNHDRLLVAPGGNGPDCPWGPCTGVMFPAREYTVVAVAGTYTTCGDCLYGPEIDFTVLTGNPTTGLVSQGHSSLSTSSRSSGASAVFGGIAALLWSTYPTWTRSEVLERLVICSMNYPVRGYQDGWGTPRAYLAISGSDCGENGHYTAQISGPSVVGMDVACTWTATTDMPDAFYAWYADDNYIGEGQQITYSAPFSPNGSYTFTLEVRLSNFSGYSGRSSRPIQVDQTSFSCSFQ
jgi:subtilisin family serine protease